MMYVKPIMDGMLIRDPVTFARVPSEGRFVEESQYWLRRVREGSLVKTGGPAEEKKPQTGPSQGVGNGRKGN